MESIGTIAAKGELDTIEAVVFSLGFWCIVIIVGWYFWTKYENDKKKAK